jgi:hypothetical protein
VIGHGPTLPTRRPDASRYDATSWGVGGRTPPNAGQ